VKMLLGVFFDLRHFLFFFLFVITGFTTMAMTVLYSPHSSETESKDEEDYVYEKYFKNEKEYSKSNFFFFIMSMRESIGDFDTDTMTNPSATNFPILAWFLWFMVMLVGNIVFMNFIIAVVSESYEKCMQSMNAETYKTKLKMILDCENFMNHIENFLPNSWRLDKKKFSPNYIILCRPINCQLAINGMKDEAWHGFV
jgi:hypothetical protein